ncbi:MAG: HAD-IA family hydrolase [Candidatus Moraniibacteriota bacterium]
MKQTIIFDLDGTLVDIEPLFLRIFNSLAPEFGYAQILPEEIPTLKKFSLRKLLFKHLGWRVFLFPLIIRRGREEYHKHIPDVVLFESIPALFDALQTHDYRIGIVSSSREDTLRSLIARHSLTVDFIYQSGLFNKAATLKKVLLKENLSKDDVIYVGDEVRDVEACRQAGISIIAVTWGLNSKEALQEAGADTVDTREALLEKILTA